jgi:hypothetical protein
MPVGDAGGLPQLSRGRAERSTPVRDNGLLLFGIFKRLADAAHPFVLAAAGTVPGSARLLHLRRERVR